MESRVETAVAKHKMKYNCTQSVMCTYADLVGLDESTAFRVAEGMGRGMGGFDCTCGSLSGACMLAGLVNSTANLANPDSKDNTYKLSNAMVQEFSARLGSHHCRTLRGIDTKKSLAPCETCIRTACELVEKHLFAK